MSIGRRRLVAVLALTGIVATLGWIALRTSRSVRATPAPMLPEIVYRDAGGSHVIRADGAAPTLIVLFDTRCGHCEYQLKDFDKRLAELAHSRIYFLTTESTLRVDEIRRRWPALAAAPFVAWGMVSAADARAHLSTLVTPTLVVFDERGAFVTKYVGEVKLDALLSAVAKRRVG
jgi:hypothetical protein